MTLIGTLIFEAVAESASPESIEDDEDLTYFDAADVPSGVETQKMIKITSNQENGSTVMMSALVQNGSLAGVMGAASGVRPESFLLRDIEKPKGVVLYEQDGYEVLKMSGKLSRTTQEGKLVISYLSNGLFGSYKTCDVIVKRDASGKYALQNAYTKKMIKEIKLIVGSVGVKTIQGLCPAN